MKEICLLIQNKLQKLKALFVIYRLAQEGALMTIPFLGHRVVRVTKKDLEILLSFSDFDHPPALGLLEQESQDKFNEVMD